MVKCIIDLGRGHSSFETDLDPVSPLGARWWRYTQWTVGDHPVAGPLEGAPVTEWRVMPLGYPPEIGGKRLLVALEDGRLWLFSPHSVFPITDDKIATEGAADFYAATVARLVKQPSLL